MLSVIIPTEGVEQTAVATLAALVPGAAAGIVREVLLVDGTRNGVIERVADVAGCRFIGFDGPSRGAALAAGAVDTAAGEPASVLLIGDSVATGMQWHDSAIAAMQEGLEVDWLGEDVEGAITGRPHGMLPLPATGVHDDLASHALTQVLHEP